MPDHPVALSLLKAFGGGIAAPSANRFCRISPTKAAHVEEELGDAVDLILDGGSCQVGVESTIIDLSGKQPKLLRLGHMGQKDIEAVLQTELLMVSSQTGQTELRAPGMMAVHYAPTTCAVICPTDHLQEKIDELFFHNKKIGLLSHSQKPPENKLVRMISMPLEGAAYAQVLYSSLRELDSLKLDIIIIEKPPTSEAWQAINDRLKKATSTD
jgi:L-threonylcarbamoyladenylate synthase